MSPRYSDEFKEQIVLLRQEGKKVVDLCKDYNLGKNTVTGWMQRYSKSGNFSKRASLSAEEQENLALKQQVKSLKLELDVLKQLALVLEIKRKGK